MATRHRRGTFVVMRQARPHRICGFLSTVAVFLTRGGGWSMDDGRARRFRSEAAAQAATGRADAIAVQVTRGTF